MSILRMVASVSGSYSDRSDRLNLRFGGVIYQKQNIVSGNFLGDGETGRLLGLPVPP